MQQSQVDPCSGSLIRITVANPGAQTNWAYATPANYIYRLRSIAMTLTTDVNVANREIQLLFQYVAPNHISIAFRNQQTASLTKIYTAAPGLYDFLPLASNLQIAPLPFNLLMQPNLTIQSNIILMQAADTITDIILEFERWVLQSA